MKKLKCKVCKNKFKPKRKRMYIAKDVTSIVFSSVFLRECHDCPRCGCQNVLNTRLDRYEPKEKEEAPVG